MISGPRTNTMVIFGTLDAPAALWTTLGREDLKGAEVHPIRATPHEKPFDFSLLTGMARRFVVGVHELEHLVAQRRGQRAPALAASRRRGIASAERLAAAYELPHTLGLLFQATDHPDERKVRHRRGSVLSDDLYPFH